MSQSTNNDTSKELAKSFEPADIEARWYPIWEKRGYFDAGLDPKKPGFCIQLPPPNITGILHTLNLAYVRLYDTLLQDISLDVSTEIDTLEASLETMSLGALLGLWLQSFLIHVTMWALNIVIFVIVYGRMIEIYLLTSLAPLPVATLSNRELGSMGQNYLKSLFAVGFQGMLILVCVAIYAVLIQGIATGGDPIGAIWGCVGYTVLLCFCLFKTGTIARSIFSAH